MFEKMSASLKQSIDQCDGYLTGMLIVDNQQIYLLTDDKQELDLESAASLEVMTFDGLKHTYHEITYENVKRELTAEGWPLYAGFYCRVKKGDLARGSKRFKNME